MCAGFSTRPAPVYADVMESLFGSLTQILGPAGCSTDPERIAPRLREWRNRHHGRASFLALPASTEQASAVVRLCRQAGAALTLQGGNTGLVGGQIPDGEILLGLDRMNRIRRIDADDAALIAEAGCTLDQVRAAADAEGLLFPLHLGSSSAASIGGLVSTNAGGVHVLRYGMMRDLVLGLEVVLADGTILRDLSSLRKNNTGYDLKQLFIGAEGTLGLVTAASLKLVAKPAAELTAVADVPDPQAALAMLRETRFRMPGLAAFELMNRLSVQLALQHFPDLRDPLPGRGEWLALLEFNGPDATQLQADAERLLALLLERGHAKNAVVAQNNAQSRAFWALRERIPAAHKLEGAEVNHDIAVPISAVPAFLDQAQAMLRKSFPDCRTVAFGHIGDGNIHFTVLQSADAPKPDPAFLSRADAVRAAVQEIAWAAGGSISAEHGVGVARREELPRYKAPEALALMRLVKHALDPANLFNPRVLFAAEPTP